MKPENVIAWREALTTLSDQHFFDLIRMYLGAVKTPFNKQKLIEELSAFLRRKETREGMIRSLDDFDLMILSAIHELPSPTQQKIVSLFAGTRSFPEIYERILNLEERLLVYRRGAFDGREYALNPLLEDALVPLLGPEILVPPAGHGEPVSVPVRADDLTLAALYSFFLQERDAVKNDGSFRKKIQAALDAVFPQLYDHPDCVRYLFSAFLNLGLFVRSDDALVPDPALWEQFARAGKMERIAWLVAAAIGKSRRDELQGRAQVFLDFLGALEPGARYTREAVTRLAFLLSEKAGSVAAGKPHGRLAALLREQAAEQDASVRQGEAGMADVAFAFGLIVESGGLWTKNAVFTAAPAGSVGSPYLVVSPSFSVTVMPGFPLSDLLPLASCMEVRDIQIAGQFEITRRSCNAAFDQGRSAEDLLVLFREKSARPLPGNVEFSVADWFRNFSSVSLYRGYVLQVDENRRTFFEHNEALSALILKILAPGVYLLSADGPEEIAEAFALAGLDLPPRTGQMASRRESVPLPPLRVATGADAFTASGTASAGGPAPVSAGNPVHPDGEAALRQRESLRSALDALSLPQDIHEALLSRIERRVALVPAQLDPESVRIEKLEARGMDFLGKVRIAEYALVSGSLLEIRLDEQDGNRSVLGRPVSSEKRTGDVLLKLLTEPDQKTEIVSLGRALVVRRIRGSIFSELPALRS